MQIQRIQSPNLGSNLPNSQLQSSKSKQLNSLSTLINKCVKTISILTNTNPNEIEYPNNSRNSDQIEVLAYLIDKIFQLAKSYMQNVNQFGQIQSMLQKQQNLNRSLIKKQLQYRQEQKVLVDQLHDEKNRNVKLNQYISKLNEEIRDKDLTVLHVKNQLKACQKQRQILDDSKIQYMLDQKLKSYVSRDFDKQLHSKNGVLRLGHKRRKSQDVGRKNDKKNETKKKSMLFSHKVNV